MTNIAAACENSDALLLRYSFKDRNCKHQHCHNNHHACEWTSWKWCNVQTVSGENVHENGQHDDLHEGAVTQSSRRPLLVCFPYLVFVCSLIATRTITSYLFPFNDKTNVLKSHFNIILPQTSRSSKWSLFPSGIQIHHNVQTYKHGYMLDPLSIHSAGIECGVHYREIEVRFPKRAEIFSCQQHSNLVKAHPVSYPIDSAGLLAWDNVTGVWNWPFNSI